VETIVTITYTTRSSDGVNAASGQRRLAPAFNTRRIARLNVAFENGEIAV